MNSTYLSRSEILLILVHDHTKHEGNDWANPVSQYFVPNQPQIWSETLKERIPVGGAGDAAIFRGLAKRGLIRKMGDIPYAYALTEEGLIKVVKLQEET